MKMLFIASSNNTDISVWSCSLSLRPPQNEVHPSYGRTHSRGHTSAWARTEESHHPHLLRYDAVRAQLQPWTHVWNGENLPQKFTTLVVFVWILRKLLLAKYDICDACVMVAWVTLFIFFNSLLIFAVWKWIDNEIGSRGRGRPRGWAVQSPAGENVSQRSRSNGKDFFYPNLFKEYTALMKNTDSFSKGDSHRIASKNNTKAFLIVFWFGSQGARRAR